MILVNVVSTLLLVWMLYFILKRLQITKHPLLLSTLFLFLPRFIIVRSTGAPESLFILCIIISLFFFERKQYAISSLAGFFAVITKTPGILLFVAYAMTFLEKYIKTKNLKNHSCGSCLFHQGW